MKKFIVSKRRTEIPSMKAARAAYEGMTLAPDLNGGDISPVESHEFSTEKDAREFLNKQSNDYFYNGSGYGFAEEWWLDHVEGDEDGYIEEGGDLDGCNNSNLKEFLASLE